MLALGDRVSVKRDDVTYEGVLMPSRHKDIVVIKLDNGYNIGLLAAKSDLELLSKGREQKPPLPPIKARKDLPTVSILSTGGTILASIPEMEEIATYDAEVIYQILSENMRAEYWMELARAVARKVRGGAAGVVITHGTDTMMYTAAALSFMLQTPVPVVLVGSQRSSDRPSSDAAMNAICAATVARSDIAEVVVVMHGSPSDDYCSIHRGTRVRKMHTSRRDAFASLNQRTLGRVDYLSRRIETNMPYRRRGEVELELKDRLEPDCALVKYVPGASPDILDYYIDKGYKGIVLEGTGLGHVASNWIAGIERACQQGIPVVVTSQCLQGRICDRVYDTGRDMLKAGAIEGADMLPEVALVKLMWVLANCPNETISMMKRPLRGEISPSSPLTAKG
jgi:glutamyl-tRNA(Gln) amidotransferase subunit D